MRISPIQNYYPNYKKVQPSFGTWSREVYTVDKNDAPKLSHRNETEFFRNSYVWDLLPSFLEEKYQEADKVNVYCYGCSDGSEPYSFAMKMLEHDENFAKKFFPIKAYDFDPVAIERAKRGEYEITPLEMTRISMCLKSEPKKYLDYDDKKFIYYRGYAPLDTTAYKIIETKLKDNLSGTVEFETGDILKDYKNIKKDNSIIFARNFWPYIEPEQRKEFFTNLYEHLGKNSIIVIGLFDFNGENNAPKLLEDAGFKLSAQQLIGVFEKSNKKSGKIIDLRV